jgi:hypothetical protein
MSFFHPETLLTVFNERGKEIARGTLLKSMPPLFGLKGTIVFRHRDEYH